MRTTLMILLSAGAIGGIDVIYFHLWKFRLYARRSSRKEEVTHLLRATLFPIGTGLLLIGRPQGAWFWIVLALFAVDSANSLVDTLLEPSSRAPLVVPRGELAVHFAGVTLMGAAATTFLVYGWSGRTRPTRLLEYQRELIPDVVTLMAIAAIVVSTTLLIVESALFASALRASGNV